MPVDKGQLETILLELDEALIRAFPEKPPIKALLVGGACLVFTGVTTRQTNDIDCIIFDLMGSDEDSLIFSTPLATQICAIIRRIGRRHGLKGNKDESLVFNDSCAPFLLELSRNKLPDMRMFREYQKIHLYIPDDLGFILACKFMAGRPLKDYSDIQALCQRLDIENRAQAQAVVNRFFPYLHDQFLHQVPKTLKEIFGA